jgi:hypothetical protein
LSHEWTDTAFLTAERETEMIPRRYRAVRARQVRIALGREQIGCRVADRIAQHVRIAVEREEADPEHCWCLRYFLATVDPYEIPRHWRNAVPAILKSHCDEGKAHQRHKRVLRCLHNLPPPLMLWSSDYRWLRARLSTY